ncbi:MAG: nucleotide exchange factor GrpE [Spirochaetes bacterium]|nr:nucleotide exchange factor GrpE [Spirochaetota bacterium]MBP8991886.1 nucleotide exchange factor GrpE [Spirochaetota bacterium]HOV46689.1 nucleotide exchange factor GrpE [Exilispira sp.]HPB47020.1 nucleotide exchange factor GrpE [Exilispira sp.]
MVDKSDLTENLGSNNIKNELNSDINDNAIEELLILRQTIEEKNEIIENLKKENEDLKNLSIRLKADFENYKKRVKEENKDLIRFSNQRLLQDLLPIIDDFDRAIASIPADKMEDPIFKGLTIILTNFHNLLEQKYNLKKINELNVPFDPLLHEAISLVEDPSANGMMVAEVFLPGYKIDERVLRAAKVLVKRGVSKTCDHVKEDKDMKTNLNEKEKNEPAKISEEQEKQYEDNKEINKTE